jgi:hypothetical protein
MTSPMQGTTQGGTAPMAPPLAARPPVVAPIGGAGTLASPAATSPSSRASPLAIATAGMLALVALGGVAYAVATGKVGASHGAPTSSSPAPSASGSAPLPAPVVVTPAHQATVWLGDSFTCRFEPYPGAVTYHCQLAQSSSKGVYCVGTTPELTCKVDAASLRPTYATFWAFVVVGDQKTKNAGGYNVYVAPPR